MSDLLTIDQFQAREGDTFLVQVQTSPDTTQAVPMRLASVTSLRPETSAGQREPFTLIFVQPERFHLPQSIYRFEHPTLDPCEIFVVPVGPTADGMQYEAVFT
jgi:hypothetical protein